ncbi:phage tail protein [Pseudomonas sp. S07E 245]|nr:phage tail protein [Pseudomonas sp. S07E 245]QYX51512.1 phage tail protein [Pseudomonas sp. S07E 245]
MVDQNSQFYAILTKVGAAKQANADALGIPWKITQMGLGDANGTDPTPNATQIALLNEWRRAPLNQLKVDDKDASIIVAEQVIPAEVGGHWIREIGLYDEAGDLVAVANCAPTYKPLLSQGSGRTQVVRMSLVVSSSSNVQLKIDPSVVLATREFVTEELARQDFKHSVLAATTGPITLSGLQTVDGVVLTAGARVLVKHQAAAKENGLYQVVASGAWTRSADADSSAKVTPGLLVLVERGTTNADSAWQLVTDAPITLGVTALSFEMAFGRTGVAAGTYRSVTVDAYGRVVSATNPTTVAGYGLTDVYTIAQVNTALALKADRASPAFTGLPTAPTAAAGNNSQQLANTAFVKLAIEALVAAAPGALDTLYELATAIGNDPNFATTITNMLAAKAPLDSPVLTGTPTGPTAAAGTNTLQLATTAFVQALGALKANLSSPAFTGTPTAPTAAAGTNTLQLATTAFVQALGLLKANLASPAFTGNPTAPTPPLAVSNTQVATTEFVARAVAALVDSSPAALDTLKELAAALGNDPNFSTTIMNLLAEKITAAQSTEIARNVGFRASTAVQPTATDFNFDDMTERGCSDLLVWGAHPNGPGVAAYFYLEVFNYGASGPTGQVQQRLTPYKLEANSTSFIRTRYQGNWSVWGAYVTENTLLGLLPTATAARAGILKLNHSTYSTDQTSAASAYAVGMLAAAKAGVDNVLPPDAIGGLIISSTVDAVVAVTPGRARDAADSIDIALAAAMTKRLQSSGAWAAGSGANGLFSGAKANSTWYHVFAIKKDSDGSVDIGIDTWATANNRPAAYSAYRRIGSFRTDAAGKIIPFIADQLSGGRRRFRWVTPINDALDGTLTASFTALTLSVPTNVQVDAEFNAWIYANNMLAYFSPLDTADVAVGTPSTGVLTGFTVGYGSVTGDALDSMGFKLDVRTDTLARIRARANMSGRYSLTTLGWTE